MILRPIAAAVALTLAACSPAAETAQPQPAPAETQAVHPLSGLDIVPVTVTSNGQEHTFRAEVARSDQEQWMGLRFRQSMGADEGMLFPRDPPRESYFTMQNTEIPLDLIFIGTDGRIMNIIRDAKPFTPGPYPSDGVALAVLELNGGTTARLGIEPGDRVEW